MVRVFTRLRPPGVGDQRPCDQGFFFASCHRKSVEMWWSTGVDHAELDGMPEPVVLALVVCDGRCLVSVGRSLVYRFDVDDIGMRNLAIVALTDAGRRVDEVAAQALGPAGEPGPGVVGARSDPAG